eukprot:CAMPEP_0201963038 /NCGR_PEP_ID=MMETSP0904-20121228/9025_1 /ASSEMBLY_ACC=CAM_ASM_000553 /TAXON_ID=420261 /ORGANISM="Thalassiosira antarctica, Strain CCMP982" /LENGTH=114 /DNA_ID=CAMNT_0048509561 /DNA_START=271 /DNA_END=615 /DNA_ORIENTATION=+
MVVALRLHNSGAQSAYPFFFLHSSSFSLQLQHAIFPSFNNANRQTGEETYFKIKKSTKMQKVFDTYAQRKGVQASSLRFLLDGDRIQPDATPKLLELDDQDQIDCMLEQSGGSF